MAYETPTITILGAAVTLVRGSSESSADCCTCGRQLFVFVGDDEE